MRIKFLLLLAPLILVLVFVLVVRARDSAYPRPELLVEPSQMASRRVAKQFVILDARERPKYEQGHLPNARWVDRAAWAAAFGHGDNVEEWSRRIGALGIGPESRVVAYDDSFARDAAQVWWMLRYWGVEDVRLLNGGWKGWTAEGYPTVTGNVVPVPAGFVAKSRRALLATREQLLESLNGGNLQIVDARSEKEYCGSEKLTNKRAGAIPGAKQLEWIDLLDERTHRFKPAADLRKSFRLAGITLDKPTVAYCQSGVRSAVLAVALELMGSRAVSNYHAGWAEWASAEDTPVVTGIAGRK